jgi:hypothetical protein
MGEQPETGCKPLLAAMPFRSYAFKLWGIGQLKALLNRRCTHAVCLGNRFLRVAVWVLVRLQVYNKRRRPANGAPPCLTSAG